MLGDLKRNWTVSQCVVLSSCAICPQAPVNLPLYMKTGFHCKREGTLERVNHAIRQSQYLHGIRTLEMNKESRRHLAQAATISSRTLCSGLSSL